MEFSEIRSKFLEYFKNHGHEVVGSSSLIPHDDPTLLFTNAGMVQFKGLFLGEEKRGYTRATTSQKCVRAGGKHNDLENVGYTARHHTFFEMLGNFSFGDYFKEQAILWAWELLTQGFKLPADKLYPTVFKDDDEAYKIWETEIGVPAKRITRLGEKDNFWAMGDTGPCGPCSEILIDQGEEVGCGSPDCAPGCDCDRYLEIWNLVFTQFDRDVEGKLTPLPNPNIDTGMGLERLAAVVQGVKSNYETDLFRAIIGYTQELTSTAYGQGKLTDTSFKVIADHARAATFLIGDGIMPANEGRGYVLRRIIRRAIRFGQNLGVDKSFFYRVAGNVIDLMGKDYRDLISSKPFVEGVIKNEEKRFSDTLFYGMKVLNENIEELKEKKENIIPGDIAFKLYDTYGLSIDILEDVAREEGLDIDHKGYQNSMSRQRTQSQESWKGSGEEKIPDAVRKLTSKGQSTLFLGYDELTSSASVEAIIKDGQGTDSATENDEVEVILNSTPFYGEAGGQVGDTGWILADGMRFEVTNTLKFGGNLIVHKGRVTEGAFNLKDEVSLKVDKERRKAIALNHTATHLLHASLREILGEHVKQAGSLVSPDRLRFDFSHFTQVGSEKLKEVEDLVNKHIRENYPVSTEEMTREEAAKTGAMAIFEERYGERVRLVKVGEGTSMELCGGTHTSRTGDIGVFKIASEGAVGANLRRIEALTGKAAFEYLHSQSEDLRHISSLLKTPQDQILGRLEKLLQEYKEKEKEIESYKSKMMSSQSKDILSGAREINGARVLAREVKAESPKAMREFADQIKEKIKSGIVVLGTKNEGKVMLICLVTKDLTDKYKAGAIISKLSGMVGGKGGGRPDMAQGGGSDIEKLPQAIEAVYGIIESFQ